MIIVLSSPKTVQAYSDNSLIDSLKDIQLDSHPVGLISNHTEPDWFSAAFDNTNVVFAQFRGRQSGAVIKQIADHYKMEPYNVLVLAGGDEDLRMGKNGGAIVIGAGWCNNRYVRSIGIAAKNADDLKEIVRLTAGWPGNWWYSGSGPTYDIRALADLSTHYTPDDQAQFAKELTSAVKVGGSKLNSLLAITARSLLIDGFGEESGLLWGVYPSSKSLNNDTDVLSEFTHRLRTTVSRVQYSKIGEPLFWRHTPSVKRSAGGSSDRNDPTDQIETIHINPFYKGKIQGKHVVVVDDCTTYGVSFAVATAFLKKAGARKVTGIALGKFGNQLKHRDIEIDSDPFMPVTKFTFGLTDYFTATTSDDTRYDLTQLV